MNLCVSIMSTVIAGIWKQWMNHETMILKQISEMLIVVWIYQMNPFCMQNMDTRHCTYTKGYYNGNYYKQRVELCAGNPQLSIANNICHCTLFRYFPHRWRLFPDFCTYVGDFLTEAQIDGDGGTECLHRLFLPNTRCSQQHVYSLRTLFTESSPWLAET